MQKGVRQFWTTRSDQENKGEPDSDESIATVGGAMDKRKDARSSTWSSRVMDGYMDGLDRHGWVVLKFMSDQIRWYWLVRLNKLDQIRLG